MATAKTRAALKNQSDTTFPTGTEEIVAVEHREFNEDSDASALNIVDPAAQIIVSKVDFLKQISSIGGLGKLTTFDESIKADMQGVVPDLAQTGAWNFVKDPSVVDDEGLKNGLTFLFIPNGDAINFSADFDVTSDVIVAGSTYIFSAWWRGTKFSVNMTRVGSADYIDFEPQTVIPDFQIGRIFYDEVEHTHTAFNDLEGTSLQIGEELRARLTNDTGATLADGVAVAVMGAVGANLAVELLDATDIDSAVRAIGLITLEAIDGADTYSVRFGAVRNLNTIAFNPGDVLFADPATLGGLTKVRPVAPNYPIRIGVCIASDALLGVVGVDTLAFNGTDTTVNIEGTLNGVVVETPLVEFYESAGNIFAEVTNQNMPANNLAFILGGIRYLLDTTTGPGPNGGATGQLVPGADDETLFENFIYVWLNGGTPELKISTLSTPDTLAPIGKASIFDETRTIAEGVYKWRRYNDAPDNGVDDGFNRWSMDATRDKLGTTYSTGLDGTPVVNSTPSVKLATTAGEAMQAHKNAFTLQDGDSYWVYNDETNQATYAFTDDLASIVETALGASLAGNGRYYRLRVYGQAASPGGGALAPADRLLVTRPLGFYLTPEEAVLDPSGFDVAPNDIKTEGVLFRLYTLVIARTGGSGVTWELVQLIDNRTRLVGGGGGGGGAGGGGGTDDKVRATATDTTNSFLDDKLVAGSLLTKTLLSLGANEQLEVKLGGTGTEDTFLDGTNLLDFIVGGLDEIAKAWKEIRFYAKDLFYASANDNGAYLLLTEFLTTSEGTLFSEGLLRLTGNQMLITTPELLVDVPESVFTGQVTVLGITISFTATPTFDFVNGNVQKMIITSNVTTLTVSNELPSGSYRVFLTENGTGGYTIPTPDSSWGTELDNSAAFETGADAVNIIDLAVDPDGNKFYSINVKQ